MRAQNTVRTSGPNRSGGIGVNIIFGILGLKNDVTPIVTPFPRLVTCINHYVSMYVPSMFAVLVLVPVESVLSMVLAMVKGSR